MSDHKAWGRCVNCNNTLRSTIASSPKERSLTPSHAEKKRNNIACLSLIRLNCVPPVGHIYQPQFRQLLAWRHHQIDVYIKHGSLTLYASFSLLLPLRVEREIGALESAPMSVTQIPTL
ncbi:hypothetical protein K443DRAFT_381412 [Laccaria amethystina LaAM-08-1]|uniref:Uncharacterized protein n=1 Tax=Laccaria amethystina LaAM-08-1 TaxID=1095629 RepID=A0A0C9X7V9_9AGAR|nr:hypothetical protein K443DRAFT_381412 [Laccaria amethystina LaAM-08-1]